MTAFFQTQSYITEICYFEFLPSFLMAKTIFLTSSEQYITQLHFKPHYGLFSQNIHLFAQIHLKS